MSLASQQRARGLGAVAASLIKRILVGSLAACGLLLVASSARANDIYLGQGSGAGNGVDCADAYPSSWFNNSSNWGTGASQIGPGTTVHLCGTITGAAGATGLTFQGSGSSGHPITLLFENGAVMTSPQWGVAITSTAKNYITIDGGSNGLIQNTQSGTLLSYHNATVGISIAGGNSVEIRNLNISNMYVHTGTGSDGGSAGGIAFQPGALNNLSIHNNTIHDAHSSIFIGYTSLNGADIYRNTTYNQVWGIALLDDNVGSTATNVNVHDNDVHDFANWFDTGFNFHFDGIFFAATEASTSLTNSNIYNNYIHGAMNVNGTGYIYLTGSSGGLSGINIFNNVIVTSVSGTGSPEANIVLGFGPKNIRIVNNTLVSGEGIRIRDSGSSGNVIQNNIFYSCWMAIEVYANNSVSVSNLNVFNNLNGGASGHWFAWYGTWEADLPAWQSASRFDANSVTGSPSLDANYHPQTGSSAIRTGVNLTNLGIAALNADKAGTPRPSTGNWDIGAYQNGSAAAGPAAPSGLTAVVQ